jgi:hypothetical protein
LDHDTLVLDTENVMVDIALPRATDWLSKPPERLILGTGFTVAATAVRPVDWQLPDVPRAWA